MSALIVIRALWMKGGDIVEIEISGIGVLSNPVKDEAPAKATRAA
ncbi:2-keto-4-pentenoate hydratase/2-oxohepta-3-ene-1,7-dioic acid hydratase in catechol pathway [Bradyrhizobium sp. F1.13.4]